MKSSSTLKRASRQRRHRRVRKTLSGVPDRPRLAVFRSNRQMYAQLIDDTSGITVASASTLGSAPVNRGSTIEAAKTVGVQLAERAAQKGVSKVVFDRGGFAYHGRVRALAEAARESGLEF